MNWQRECQLRDSNAMPRALRTEYPGAVYHVMSRDNHNNLIFHDDPDREAFLRCLEQASEKTGLRRTPISGHWGG